MSETTSKSRIISLYTEATPNPASMKFVMNKMLYSRNYIEIPDVAKAKEVSPMAEQLFEKPFVRSLFISNNFLTLTRVDGYDWQEIIPEVKDFLREYIGENKPVMNESAIETQKKSEVDGESYAKSDTEIVEKIKGILEKYVQPAVEMDGGTIVFRSYDNGIVKLGMQGACSGCPSSTVTLKAGIEGMMKRMLPEVKEVVADSM